MITRLEVDGFKSLRDFAVDLDPFTVFIGPNSAGKSNILEALALLSRLASQPIAEAFKGGRGRPSDQFTRQGGEAVKAMRFAIEVLEYGDYELRSACAPPRQSRYRYELTIERRALSSSVERLVARDERLFGMKPENDRWIAERPEFSALASYKEAGIETFVTIKDEERVGQRMIGLPTVNPEERRIPSSHTALASAPFYVGVSTIQNNLLGCQQIALDAKRVGDPSDRLGSGGLAEDLSNLPTVLGGLSAPLLGEIRADLAMMVPDIASFYVVAEGDDLRIDFEHSGGERLPAKLVSDGTLRLLALLTALRQDPRPGLLAIEEPENGIYPGRLRRLVDLLRAETKRRHDDPDSLMRLDDEIESVGAAGMSTNLLAIQVLVTTHSPVILSALRKQPQHLRFIDTVRRDGHRISRVRTVGRPATPAEGRLKISPREIDQLLDSTRDEATE